MSFVQLIQPSNNFSPIVVASHCIIGMKTTLSVSFLNPFPQLIATKINLYISMSIVAWTPCRLDISV